MVSGFPNRTLCTPPPYVPNAPPISFFSILPPAQYSVSNTDHWAPHCVIFSIPCYLVPLRPKYSPQHPQPTFLPINTDPKYHLYTALQERWQMWRSLYKREWYSCAYESQLALLEFPFFLSILIMYTNRESWRKDNWEQRINHTVPWVLLNQ